MILKEAMRLKKNKEGTQVAKHKDKKSFKARLSSIIMCAPVTIWSVLFVLVPVGMLLFMSFMTKGPLGKIVYKFTLDNYAEIFKPVYVTVVKQSLLIAVWTTVLTILLGYPLATVIAHVKKKTSGVLTVLLMLPLWVSGLVILYSFVVMLNNSGIINTVLMSLGIIKKPKAIRTLPLLSTVRVRLEPPCPLTYMPFMYTSASLFPAFICFCHLRYCLCIPRLKNLIRV